MLSESAHFSVRNLPALRTRFDAVQVETSSHSDDVERVRSIMVHGYVCAMEKR
ncbi:unnamed protein product [Cylicostephanus goldi]|uniref:Uncharacterized protein n=1 Tax=Cylicostephanus goldi TaxID=71465 RepID=A0A3P6S1E8_CYLGO|nr:unnamed protein product [Cylicostephanus goldi]